MTSTIALLGHPVVHSISPRFQQAALDALGLDARYEAWDTPRGELESTVERLRSGDVLGANVTIPHKEAVLRLIERADALAERIGAVNTVYRRDGRLHATNTDVAGLLAALEAEDVDLRGIEAVILGAGGAARAAVVALRRGGAARVTIANRTLARAQALRGVGGDELAVDACPLDPGDPVLVRALRTAGLVIHSTPQGMAHGPDEGATPVPPELLNPSQLAFDLVYVPERTPFLRAAEAAGARTLGGLSMLVHQGAESFKLWTGLEPPIEVMFEAAREALAEAAT